MLQAAPFTWSMPDRYGQDANGDGLIDYPTSAQILPASWPVRLDACAITGSRYTWYVGGDSVASVTTCALAHPFPAEGAYEVAVNVTGSTDTTVRSEGRVVVQDWLILSLGDSYGSGEGNPDIPMATDALIAQLESSMTAMQAAQLQLLEAQRRLADALEAKGVLQHALNNAIQLRNEFLAACSTLISFSCVNFLVDHALEFASLEAARAFFNQLVSNAQERLNDASAAVVAAQNAVAEAQDAVAAAQAAINLARAGFVAPVWHSKHAVETYADPVQCHRSANAAPARAALALERADPRTSVTFVHLACSGAKIEGGGQGINQQITWASQLMGDREIDAVLVSIGGNDAGFSSLATSCVEQQPCYSDNPDFDPSRAVAACAPLQFIPGAGAACSDFFATSVAQQSAKQVLDSAGALLPGRYADLATQYLPRLPGLLGPDAGGGAVTAAERLRSERVYISEYGNMTRGDAGNYCTPDPFNVLGTMPGITIDEMEWLEQTAAARINGMVRDAAAAHGWNLAAGIPEGYATHGYCAQDHWVTRLDESFLRQGDMQGTAHPNLPGQGFSGAAIEAALLQDLFPGGTDQPGRAPDAAGVS